MLVTLVVLLELLMVGEASHSQMISDSQLVACHSQLEACHSQLEVCLLEAVQNSLLDGT